MNGPFQVAQASSTAGQSSAKLPKRIVKITKPYAEQSVTVPLSYDGSVKADLTAIAGEKITLVHIGEKLIILFDNKSTVTLEPYFDATGKPLDGITLEVSPGRDLTGTEFAALFPVTDDQSVLPAAGDGDGNAQASGANFSNVGVDPLALPGPLALLGQEELPGLQFTTLLGPTVAADQPLTASFTLSGTPLVHDETAGVQSLPANDQSGAPPFAAPVGAPALIGWAQTSVSEIASASVDFGTHGAGTVTYALTNAGGGVFNGTDSGLHATKSGNEIFLYTEGDLIVGREGNGSTPNPGGTVAFVLFLEPGTLLLDVAQYAAISHSNTADANDSLDLGSLIHVTQTATAGDGTVLVTTSAGGLSVSFLDDGPGVTAEAAGVSAALDETAVISTAAAIDTGAIVKGDDPDVGGAGTIAHAVSAGALVTPTAAFGTDGPAASNDTTYALSITNAASGLSVTDGSAITLQLVGDVVVGIVNGGAFNGQAAFAIAIDSSTGVVTVEQYLSLNHPDNTDPNEPVLLALNALAVTVTVTDGDGDHASASVDITQQITFRDDGPSVTVEALPGVTAALDETAVTSAAATIDTGAFAKGDDPDVAGTGTIAHAVSAGALVSPNAVFGADGPATSGDTTYVLTITNATSGLSVTDGSPITLQQVGNAVVGVVNGGAFDGQAAFAISINSATGVVTVEQYLSLHHPDNTDPDDQVALALSSLAVTVTVTDGDGDRDSASADVSHQITFDDDGPGVSVVAAQAVTAALDETATTSTAATINTGAIVQGDDPDVGGTGYIAHAVSAGALVTPTAAFGADGPAISGNTTYALTITNATSGLSVTDGSAITLQLEGNVVVGVVNGGAFNGQAAFAISIDSATGVVTVEQYLSLHHPDNTNPDDQVALALNALAVTVTVTDGDGDQDSATADVSQQITFDDDGPDVSVVASGVTAALDETATTSTAATINTGAIVQGDDPDVGGTGYIAHVVSAGALVTPTAAFGADGPAISGDTTYALTITNATSGLSVTDGSAITLQLEGNVVVGVVNGGVFNGQAAFAISIDGATGVVTVEQYLSLHHPDNTDPDDQVALALNSLAVTVTVTDGDGDQDSATADVSAQITFDDDGPDVSVVAATTVTAALDETAVTSTAAIIDTGAIVKGDDPDVGGTGTIAHAVSAAALVSPTAVFGADGPATSGDTTYALTITNATSGLSVTDGSAITLQLVGDVVVGVVNGGTFNGQAAFAISIDSATGVVTVEQYLSLHHPDDTNPDDQVALATDSLAVTVTVTDGDGDQDSASADVSQQVRFDDDGPDVSVVVSKVTAALDETAVTSTAATINTGAIVQGDDPDVGGTGYIAHAVSAGALVTPTAAFGADGPATSGDTTYALTITNATSGLSVTDGSAITLQLEGNVVVGVVNGGTFNGQAAFAISIDSATGVVTVEQYLSLHHPDDTNPDDQVALALNSLSVTVTVTDGDGDQDSASADVSQQITFDDDGPVVTATASSSFHVIHDESLLLQGDADDILFTSVFNGVTNPGHDPSSLGLPLGYARSAGSALTIGTLNFGADGPATASSQTFTLTLTDPNGVPTTGPIDSGLKTTDGHAIFLFVENGQIVGRYDGSDADSTVTNTGNDPAAFALAINATTGIVSAVQYVSLLNPDASDADDAVSLQNMLGSVKATLTIVDGDGDTASASATISGDIQFQDDGPLVAVAVPRNFGVTADESPGLQANDVATPLAIFANVPNPGDDTDETGPVLAYATSSGNALAIVPYFGVDGPDPTTPVTYSLQLNSPVSGVTLTDGSPISLHLENDGGGQSWIVGRVDSGTDQGKAAFAIAIDPLTGNVSVVAYLSLNHPNASNPNDTVSIAAGTISAVVTIKDGDGDTASASADISGRIRFNDDGPKIIAKATVMGDVDEDGLHLPGLSDSNLDNGRPGEEPGTDSAIANGAIGALKALVNFGADGFGSFALKTIAPFDSGLTSQNEHILIVSDGSVLHGYVDNATPGYDAGDREVFTLTVGSDGSYVFTLKDQIDHPTLDNQAGDDTENTLAIDLSSYVVATDGDGDSVPLGTGTFTVTVLDDIPVVTARPPGSTTTTTTETITYVLQAGNTDVRGMDGQNNHDIKLTGIDLNEGDNSVNTTGTKIGVGDGQIIDGLDTHPGLSGPEILTMTFVNNLQITGNPNNPTITDSGSYDVSSATFSIDVAEAQGVETAVVFVSATNNGSFVALTFTVNGLPVAATPVFQGGVQVGYVLDGVSDLSTVHATGATPFDVFKVGNYNNYQFDTTAGGTPETLTDGNSFKVYGIEAAITTTTVVAETFKVSEDESPGVNTAADPNAANDVDPLVDIPPVAIAEAGAIGYAKSPTSVLASGSLFAGKVGADEPGTYSFAITDANGDPINGVDSGLTTLDGSHIMLSTDASGAILGSVGPTEIFRVYVDASGYVWIAQYQPIAHNLDGSSAAAFDDIATVTADLHIKATLTDFDGDAISAVSGVALQVQFQDDGPLAVNDVDSANGATLTATGNVITAVDIPVGADANSTDGNADTKGTDGAKITEVSGVTTDTTPDAAHTFQVTGQYGTLVINENGDYTYTRFNGSPVVANDVFTYTLTDGDGDFSTAKLTISISDRGVSISGIGATGGDKTVFENDLSASRGPGESDGSSPNAANLTQTGTFHVSAPDGVDDLSIGGTLVVQNGVVQNLNTPFNTTYGVLTITGVDLGTGTVSYSYTLVDNTLAHGPLSNGGANSIFDNVAVQLTDVDGDTANSSLIVKVVDDVPTAVADTDNVAANVFLAEAGNVVTAVGTTNAGADTLGADGAVVAGVAAGNTGTNLDSAATINAAIAGLHGTLTLQADGSYSYQRTAGSQGGVNDVFTYTLKDGDGDLSHTTLTIAIGDSTPTDTIPAPGGATTTVFEAGLPARGLEPAGSNEPANSETTSGSISFTSPDGITTVSLGGHVLTTVPQTFPDATGSLTASYSYNPVTGAGSISYSYTLVDNTLVDPSSVSFAVVVTDADGDSAPAGNLVITIIDDVPTAVADTDSVAANVFLAEAGNVVTAVGTTNAGADTLGADGAVVAGVAAGNTGSNLDSAVTVNAAIAGLYGTLTLQADGSYSYQRNAGSQGGVNDVFTYTLKDGDGDLSHTTLTIAIGDSTPTDNIPAPGGATTTVFEAGLPARGLEPAGSNEPANSETTAGSINFTSPDGITTVSLGGHALTAAPQTFNDATGSLTASYSYNPVTGAGSISYSYTLVDNTLVDPSSVSFAVVVTDADGDSAPAGNLVINIIDDVPTAVADTDGVAANMFLAETGNVITAVGTTNAGADTLGADGAVVAGVAAGNTGTDLDSAGTVNAAIAGLYGTLTLQADGSYSYQRNAGSQGGVNDVFTYTVKDGDGDLSHTTLTIAIGDSTPTDTIPAPGGATTTVFEAGLPARPGEPAGSNEPANSETTSGSISFTSPDGITTVSLGGHALTAAPQTFTDATGSLTASYSYNPVTGAGSISYSYTLVDNTLVDPSSVSFAVVVTDADGDSAPAGNLVINIIDDVPTAHADTDSVAANVFLAETGNVVTALGTTNAGADTLGADGAVVAGVAAGNTGADLDSAGTVNAAIAGLYGTLTLQADGSYSYQRNAGSQGGVNDVFTYTLKDGDGDLSHTTLTIAIGDSTPTDNIPAPGGATTTVFEAGLPARGLEPAGSSAAANSETTAGSISFTSPDGITTVSLGGHALTAAPQTFNDATGSLTASYTYNPVTGTGSISYSYTLVDNTLVDPSGVSFAVVVTDADGDSAPAGNLVINIIDDVPTAHADTDSVTSGTSSTDGNVLTGVNTTSGVAGIDVPGADGAAVNRFVAGTIVGDVTGATVGSAAAGGTINTAKGTLTLDANGQYTYTANVGAIGNDVFTYTIRDGDGDLSTTTLTITIENSVPQVVDGLSSLTVQEAALDRVQGGNDLAAGIKLGTNPSSTAETSVDTNGLQFHATGENIVSIKFADPNNLVDAYATPALANLGSGTPQWSLSGDGRTLTLSFSGQAALILALSGATSAAAGTDAFVTVTATLVDHFAHQIPASVLNVIVNGVKVVATDSSGDEVAGTVTTTIVDDAPVNFTAQSMVIENGTNAAGSGALNFYESIGADSGSVVFTGVNGSTLLSGGNPVTSGGKTVHLYGYGTGTLSAKIDLDGNAVNGDETTVFTVALAPNTSDETQDLYNVQFFRSLDDGSGNTITPSNFTDTAARDYKVVEDATATNHDILISGYDGTNSDTVNGSNGGGVTSFGVHNPAIGSTEILRFDFASNVALTGSGSSNGFTYGPHYNVNGFAFTVQNGGTTSVFVKVYDANDDSNLTNDNGSADTITSVYKNGVLTSFTTSNGGIVVSANNGDVIAVYTADGYNRAEIGYVSGETFAVANVGYLQINTGNNLPLHFNLTATDADGDTSTGGIDITTTPITTTMTGTAASDLLVAGNGGETLIGLAGNDTLTGGIGADHFRYNAPTEGTDHITDFVSGTDRIDVLLSAFTGLSGGTGAITAGELFSVSNVQDPNTINIGTSHFAYQQSTGQLFYDSDGGGSANRVLLAVLDNHAAVTASDVHKV